MARPICLRLLLHLMRLAASRTFWTAGNSRPIRTAMMAMTTSSSMSVKPTRCLLNRDLMRAPPRRGKRKRIRGRSAGGSVFPGRVRSFLFEHVELRLLVFLHVPHGQGDEPFPVRARPLPGDRLKLPTWVERQAIADDVLLTVPGG